MPDGGHGVIVMDSDEIQRICLGCREVEAVDNRDYCEACNAKLSIELDAKLAMYDRTMPNADSQIAYKQEQDILAGFTPFYVLTRFGWGWEVRGPNEYKSAAFGTQQEAVDHARRKMADSSK